MTGWPPQPDCCRSKSCESLPNFPPTPHLQPITMGISSFSAIVRGCAVASHSIWNQDVLCQAPQPHVPEASKVIVRWLRCRGCERKEMPFHWVRNSAYQAKSARKAESAMPLLYSACSFKSCCSPSLCYISQSMHHN